MRTQFGHRHLEVLVLLLAGGELLAQLFELPFHVGHFLFLLRLVLADLAHGLLRGRQLLGQLRVLRYEHLDAVLRLFRVLQFVQQFVALFRDARDLRVRFRHLLAFGFFLFLGGSPAFLRGSERFFQLRDFRAERFLFFVIGAV